MIYLIGGPAKVGKSKLAERLLQERGIPYIPTDIVIEVLKDRRIEHFASASTRADDFWPYFASLMKVLPGYRRDFCVEGNAFLPEHIHRLQKNDTKVKACFLGLTKTTLKDILAYAGPQTWLLTDLTEQERKQYPQWLAENSRIYEQQAAVYGLPYFDLAGNYEAKLTEAYYYLVDASKR